MNLRVAELLEEVDVLPPSTTPASTPTTFPVPSTCAPPRPNTERRSSHRREGCNSSPMRKSSSTTPSSAKWRMLSTSEMAPMPQGPMTIPAAR